jgi:hypothetical protein
MARSTTTATANATSIQVVERGTGLPWRRPMRTAIAMSTATAAALAPIINHDPLVFGAGALNFASVVAAPHLKQMSALSAISIPH